MPLIHVLSCVVPVEVDACAKGAWAYSIGDSPRHLMESPENRDESTDEGIVSKD